MTGYERDELKKQLNGFNNVGDMIKYLYMTYDTSAKLNPIHKSMIVNALLTAVSLLNLKKHNT